MVSMPSALEPELIRSFEHADRRAVEEAITNVVLVADRIHRLGWEAGKDKPGLIADL
jgi:hypothetical protein